MADLSNNLLDQIGSCSICFERYEENGKKEPRNLPCGHTFCLDCVSQIVTRPDPVCPVCRKGLQSKSLDSYPKNFSVIQIITTLSSLPSLVASPAQPENHQDSGSASPVPAPTESTVSPVISPVKVETPPPAESPVVQSSSHPEMPEVHGEENLDGDPAICPGVRVVICRQRPVNGVDGWDPSMDKYENKSAVVVEICGRDDQGCRTVILRQDNTRLSPLFRARDLRIIGRDMTLDSLSGDSSIVIGSFVRISKHREVNGKRNWSNEMDKFIDKIGVVVNKCGKDNQDCALAKLAVDGAIVSDYVFRIRDLKLVPSPHLDESLEGPENLQKGSLVVINRHRPVKGGENWVKDMDRYVGRVGRVTDFIGHDKSGCRMCTISVDDEVVKHAFRARDLIVIGNAGNAPNEAERDSLTGDSRIVVGSKVIIHKHRPVAGSVNWAADMDRFIGSKGEVQEFTGNDSKGCRMARIKVNGVVSEYVFRVRDLELADDAESLSGDARIVVGSTVVIHKHRPVEGNSNWASGMDKYIGCQAKVISFSGKDSKGCKMAKLQVDGEAVNYAFRVRDLELVSGRSGTHLCESLQGDPGIAIGARVIIHKHRAVEGNTNWSSGMDKLIGCQAVVQSFTGNDSKGCKMAKLTMDNKTLGFVFRVRDLELVDSVQDLAGDPRIAVGSRVMIRKHRPVDGNTNWASGMDKYVGKLGVIVEFTGNDAKGCRMARLRVNGELVDFVFRVRDLEFVEPVVSSSTARESLSGDPRIVVGSIVVVQKHRPVDGNANWASGMDQYIGKRAEVASFCGVDSKGCKMAKLKVNGSDVSYSFRVRDLELLTGIIDSYPSESLVGDSRIKVGSKVFIHKHRSIDGNNNWSSRMDSFVGLPAEVVSFTGNDSKGCRMARLRVNGQVAGFVFRVRDLEFYQ